MIDQQHGSVAIECDGCNETVEGEPDEAFDSVWKRAKADGWAARKVGKDWLHLCGKCKGLK